MQYADSRPPIPANLRRAVEIECGHSCAVSRCGEHTYLEIHHINDNREDNRIENLILLCDKHHKMAHKGIIDRKALRGYKILLASAGGTRRSAARSKGEQTDSRSDGVSDDIKILLESVQTGEIVELRAAKRATVGWVSENARRLLGLKAEADIGVFKPIRIHWVLVQSEVRELFMKMSL